MTFTDIADQPDEVKEAVGWAVREGVTKGTSATTFSPDEPVTRGQMILFLYRQAQTRDPS